MTAGMRVERPLALLGFGASRRSSGSIKSPDRRVDSGVMKCRPLPSSGTGPVVITRPTKPSDHSRAAVMRQDRSAFASPHSCTLGPDLARHLHDGTPTDGPGAP